MTSTARQGFGCARNMGTNWPEAGTRGSCGPQLCALHGTSPQQLVGSVASGVIEVYGQDAPKPNIMLKLQMNNYDLKSIIMNHLPLKYFIQ